MPFEDGGKPLVEHKMGNEQFLSLWKRMEKLEEKMEKSLEGLDQKVHALEMAHQLQTYQNLMTKEKLDNLATGQQELINSLKADRVEDREQVKTQNETVLGRLDDIQYKQKAQTYEKLKWTILGFFITAALAIVWAAIVNVPQ